MEDALIRELDSVLARMNAERDANPLNQFDRLVADVIAPALDEIANALTAEGHRAEVELDLPERVARQGHSVGMVVAVKGGGTDGMFGYRFLPGEREAHIVRGPNEIQRGVPLEAITPDRVQRDAIKYLKSRMGVED